MDDARKYAYRDLIYRSLYTMRNELSGPMRALDAFINPKGWRIQTQSRNLQCEVADWLHNLAQFSALEFERFDEDRFWQDYKRLQSLFGERVEAYRYWFEQALSDYSEDDDTHAN